MTRPLVDGEGGAGAVVAALTAEVKLAMIRATIAATNAFLNFVVTVSTLNLLGPPATGNCTISLSNIWKPTCLVKIV